MTLVVHGVFLAGPALAVMQAVPSTPDIAVTASATADFPIQGGRVTWLYLKNDCSDVLYFDLRGARDANPYPLRLGSAEMFTAEIGVYSVGVSPSAGAGACTFTVIFAR